MWPLGRKPFSLGLMSGLEVMLNTRASTAATICPSTVAAAAPATSIRGKGPRPKMSTGSMMMLMTAPTPWVIMEYMVRPVAWSSRSKVISMKMPMDRPPQMRR